MTKRCVLAFAAFALSLVPVTVMAQALPAASRGGILQVGGAFSISNTDIFTKKISGISMYSTFDFNQHLGAEVDIHLPIIQTPDDYEQKEYMVGVRYVFRKGIYEPYGKVLFGIGQSQTTMSYQMVPGTPGTYAALGYGGGLDIRLKHHLNVRAADFELQNWPSFPQHGLDPWVFSFGAAYRFR